VRGSRFEAGAITGADEGAYKMRCVNCGAEIGNHDESEVRRAERPGSRWSPRRALGRLALGIFSAGWVATAVISEYFHALYINRLHRVDFSRQTPPFFAEVDISYRFPSFDFFFVSCIWLALVLVFWAWKLAGHVERTKAIADALCSRPPAGDNSATTRSG